MARYLLLTIAFFMAGLVAHAQTSVQGTVIDAETGEPVIFGTVALYKNGVLQTGTQTDLDGFYSITEIDPGTYDIEFSYTGYATNKITGVNVLAGKANLLDSKMSVESETLTEVVVVYEAPLIEQDNTSQGAVFSKEQIKNLPTRDVNGLVALGAGVASADEGEDISIRGSRANATNYYLDGVRVFGSMIPKQDIEQLQVVTGGVEARYGDVTGGVISITTKGPSDKFGGGVELETSEYLDPYDQRLASVNVSGPILKRKGRTLLGYRVGGQYLYNRDNDPPALQRYQITDEYRQFLEENPIRLVGGSPIPEANFATNENVRTLDYNPNEERTRYDMTGKLDAALGPNIDVTLSGSFYQIENQFTPDRPNAATGGSAGATWQVFNSHNNPTDLEARYRANFRFRHRLGTTSAVDGDTQKKGSLVQNAVYILQFGYENDINEREDARHGSNFFNYGYIGEEIVQWNPTFEVNPVFNAAFINEAGDTLNNGGQRVNIFETEHTGYSPTTLSFTPNNTINPVLANYLGEDPLASNVTNGFIPTTLTNVWSNHHSNIGNVYNLYRRRDNDLYTFNANTSFELVPGGSGNARHNIQFGLLYEQRVRRGYDLNPFRLWQIAQQLENAHLLGQGLDLTNQVGTFDGFYQMFDAFTGDRLVYNGTDELLVVPFDTPTDTLLPLYASGVASGTEDNSFFRKVREKFGGEINEFFNVNAIDPSQLTLDLFSARELNDQPNLLNYWGYDYLGNQIDGVTFNDFFTSRDEDGIRNFPVAAFRPNYQAAYIQDKFTFRDVIFRVGVRVDRFDANTKVLKDNYSLYDIQGAGDFDAITGQTRPGNIGEDYKVYVASEGSESVTAYRDGDTWYFPNGTPANDGVEIFGGQIVFPRYAEPDITRRDVTSPDFDPDISFEDYEPQVNWMPRLAFSFPISDEANFFAHYDVLVQRPPSNNLVTPLTYFYWEQRTGIRNNANLRPEKTIDYEVGFQQKISNTSAIKLSAYYKELRDMIQRRFFNLVPAPVNEYETYDNLDFATVKGFSIAYDLRRTGNVSMNLAYTLQFADGTGSNANSSQGLSANGIQRALFPLSFDERHRITGIIDYRYASGKKYNGPRISGIDILANTGLNITTIGVSGRPFTQAQAPNQFGASGRLGAINGSRLPWNFTVNAQIDKSFNLTKEGSARSMGLNVYLRVSNVFDRRNIQGVYRFTGSPTDDGYLISSDGISALNALSADAGRNVDAFLASYSWRVLNPDNFSLPRRIFLGAIFDF